MTRTRLTILILTLLVVATTALSVGTAQASASTLATKLERCQIELKQAKVDLADARAALSAALLDHQRRGVGTLVLEVSRARHAVKFWQAVITDLRAQQARQQALASAAKDGDWKTLIAQAAKKYGVSASGLYRLMIMESGGKARVVSGAFFGLYQYALVTWRGSWNPWRAASVFDGAAQINATALAVRKGMGRALWANTYGAAF